MSINVLPSDPAENGYKTLFKMPQLKRLRTMIQRKVAGQRATKAFQQQVISRFAANLKRLHKGGGHKHMKPNGMIFTPIHGKANKDARIIQKWSGGEALSEIGIRNLMQTEGLHPFGLSCQAQETYPSDTVPYRRITWVAKGSITFILSELKQTITLYRGDRLDLPAHVRHEIVVGPEGVLCFEA